MWPFSRKSRHGDIAVTEFSLAPWAREELETRIRPIMERYRGQHRPEISGEDRERLAQLVQDVLPAEVREGIMDAVKSGNPCPVVIRNLPQEDIENVPGADRPVATSFTNYYVAQGLYAMMDMQTVGGPAVLLRYGADSHLAGEELHSDPYDVTMLAAPVNHEEAPTRFLHWKRLVEEGGDHKFQGVSAQDGHKLVVDIGEEMGMYRGRIQPGIKYTVAPEASDPRALKRFQDAVDRHSEFVTLGPGDLVIWNNHNIFHQAQSGIYEKIDDQQFSRVAMVVGGNSAARGK